MSGNPAIKVDTATPQSLITLACIHLAAIENDRCWQSMHQAPSYWEILNRMLGDRSTKSDYQINMAVLNNDSEEYTAGWLCCSIVGDPAATRPTPILASLEWTTAAAYLVDHFQEWQTQSPSRVEREQQRKRRRQRFNQISQKSSEMQRKLVTESGSPKFLVINTLVTDPAFQRQGVGSALLRSATQFADTAHVAIWAQVPKAARGVFERAGFAEVEGSPLVIEIVDPSEFIFCAEVERYEFLFMVRPAARVASG